VTALELGNYTRNVLLRDTDSMSMANSLEVRVPFLDHRVVEHALSLPASTKGHEKKILIDATRRLLPEEVLSRRKHGFLVPFDRWLRRELAAEVDQTLSAPPTSVAELIDPDAIGRVWKSYRDGQTSWLRPWALYSLCRWAQTLEAPVAAQ
jgi:asparagine synthase (glutamine-hydrolysing)